jgi:hypothetical protein
MLSAAETSVVLAAVCSNQSASANALHQPFGLISPSTTLHDLGGSNSVQVAHMRMSFGLGEFISTALVRQWLFQIVELNMPFRAGPPWIRP